MQVELLKARITSLEKELSEAYAVIDRDKICRKGTGLSKMVTALMVDAKLSQAEALFVERLYGRDLVGVEELATTAVNPDRERTDNIYCQQVVVRIRRKIPNIDIGNIYGSGYFLRREGKALVRKIVDDYQSVEDDVA